MKYRKEIDGLRAISVLSVVAYHAFPSALTGGFTGVDVFFVISGFLITSHIFTSLDAEDFSFGGFFGRRIRRLFPALILVMASSLIFGWASLTSAELQQLGRHVASGAAFIANFVFVGESGYFDAAADQKPMLHLWSLAVEEQFYIVWPFALWLAWRRGISLFWLTALVAVASFSYQVYFVGSKPVEIFFLPFGRFWELLIGSLLAWVMIYKSEPLDRIKRKMDFSVSRLFAKKGGINNSKITNDILAVAGLILLAFSFTSINSDKPFPSYWAVVPVAGACLIIAGGASAWINRTFLMNPVAVWFGTISYPLYLWHWPIFSFIYIVKSGDVHSDAFIAAILLAIFLSWLTVKFVEKPLRFGEQNSRLKTIWLSSAMILVGVLGIIISKTDFSQSHKVDNLLVPRKHSEFILGASPRWYLGKEGWLFLGNTYDDTVAELVGAKLADINDVSKEVQSFRELADVASTTSTSVALLIGPNKSSVYSEFLPDEFSPSDVRYIDSFTGPMESIQNLIVLDPTKVLLEAKEEPGFLYYRTDTHWNAKGAYLAFSELLRELRLPSLDISFEPDAPYSGDLVSISGVQNVSVAADDNWRVKWKRKLDLESKTSLEDPETPFGTVEIVSNRSPASDKVVWVVGDSFASGVRPFLNAAFSEVHYLGHWNGGLESLSEDLLSAEARPDLILIIRVERSF